MVSEMLDSEMIEDTGKIVNEAKWIRPRAISSSATAPAAPPSDRTDEHFHSQFIRIEKRFPFLFVTIMVHIF